MTIAKRRQWQNISRQISRLRADDSWNSPVQIDRWLAEELREEKVAAVTGDDRRKNFELLSQAYVLHLRNAKKRFPDRQWEWNIDATLGNFTNVMLGISIRDDDVDVTDTPSVSKP